MLVKNIGERSFQCGGKGESHKVVLAPGKEMDLPEKVAGKLLKMFGKEVVAIDSAGAAKAKAAAEKAEKKAEEKKAE